MILIADSGSTKATWCIGGNGEPFQTIVTPGINPYFQSEEEIGHVFSKVLLPVLHIEYKDIKAVYFYGAGCTFDKTEKVRDVIKQHIPAEIVEVNSDLLAVARGICGREAGIACILGTGSNSCFYDGNDIIETISPLGFILGDEGGGSYLGKLLVSDLLKNMLPAGLKEKFLKQYNLTPAQIIDRVYRQPFPNRFLASLSPFISENIDKPEMRQLVYDAFKAFFIRNLMKYDYKNHTTSFSGSVAYSYRDILQEVAHDMDVTISSIAHSPMDGLIIYHTT